jgi:hypothetical protein
MEGGAMICEGSIGIVPCGWEGVKRQPNALQRPP